MRAIIFTVALAAVALSGCDQTPTATVAPPAQACNCQPAAPAPVVAPAPTQAAYPVLRRRHHRAWARREYSRSDDSESEYSQSEISTYGYVSDSRSIETGEEQGDYSEASAQARNGGVWVDGYGRGYDTDGHAVRAGTMRGKRLAPWRGYDADCDR
jgi:hypothetical protein